jgi:hypothetical protein
MAAAFESRKILPKKQELGTLYYGTRNYDPRAGFAAALPQAKGGMKDLETKKKKCLRLMWEAASGGRTRHRALWRLCREMTAVMVSRCFFEARIVPAQSFSSRFIFCRAARSPAGGGLPHWSDLRFSHRINACSELICGGQPSPNPRAGAGGGLPHWSDLKVLS